MPEVLSEQRFSIEIDLLLEKEENWVTCNEIELKSTFWLGILAHTCVGSWVMI
jgi:hypothetical protein